MKPMHKKQAKKSNKNQVGVYKNTPLASQTSYEGFEEFISKYLDISSPGMIFDLLDHSESPYFCECPVTEEMLLDSLIDLEDSEEETKQKHGSFYDAISKLKFDEESSTFHSEYYNKILLLYNKQREINIRNSKAIKEYIKEPLEYFGTAKLLRDLDLALCNIFKKKKYKKIKKGNKIFDKMIKTVDNSAAEEYLNRFNEFKEVFPSLDYPIYEKNLCEENVETEGIIKDGFLKY